MLPRLYHALGARPERSTIEYPVKFKPTELDIRIDSWIVHTERSMMAFDPAITTGIPTLTHATVLFDAIRAEQELYSEPGTVGQPGKASAIRGIVIVR